MCWENSGHTQDLIHDVSVVMTCARFRVRTRVVIKARVWVGLRDTFRTKFRVNISAKVRVYG